MMNHCRDILEQAYDKPFPSASPDWLQCKGVEARSTKLTLGAYCEELKLAVEYHDKTHYQISEGWTREQLVHQMKIDAYKTKKCFKNGVYLAIVPFWVYSKEDYLMYIIENYNPHI